LAAAEYLLQNLEGYVKKIVLCAALVLMSCGFAFGQTYKVLYNFEKQLLASGLVADKAGNFYGVNEIGGTQGACFGPGCGTVWQLSPNGKGGWQMTTLYTFCKGHTGFDCPDGGFSNPLIIDSAGNLYGVTSIGGIAAQNGECIYGCGVAFELSPPQSKGKPWTYSLLHTFCSVDAPDCLDGALPRGPLALDASGNLYGATGFGGSGENHVGVAYELSPGTGGWNETVLYNFCSVYVSGLYCADGQIPGYGVTLDAAGNIYGTTDFGGSATQNTGGALYKLSPSSNGWIETILWGTLPLETGQDDLTAYPGQVTIDPEGNLYTTMQLGGNYNDFKSGNGGVFQIGPNGTQFSFLFDWIDGSNPASSVLIDSTRHVLYGVTSPAGENYRSFGNVYQIDQRGQESVLHTFCQENGCPDGSIPGFLYEDKMGNLYGNATTGGANGAGVVYEITP
jgi:hypothetical protein